MIITRSTIRSLIKEEFAKAEPAKRSLFSYLFEDVKDAKQKRRQGRKDSGPSRLKLISKEKSAASNAESLDGLLLGGESTYSKFVETLKKAIDNPYFKEMIKSGSEEDIIKVEDANTGVKDLTPVQKEIGVSNSFGYIAKNAGAMAETLEAAKAGAGGEKLKIVTLNGKYIVDGHHRWSQLYMLNPNATIMSYDMQVPLNDPANAMKVAQLAIAAEVEKVPSSGGDTKTDMFAALKEDSALKKYLEGPMYSKLLEAIAAKGLVNQKTGEAATNREQAIQMLVDHCAMLKSKGTATKISRGKMPQFAPDVGGPNFPEVIPDLSSGEVNWKGIAGKPGKAGEKKEESASRNSDNVILERWAKLAGLIKG